MDAEGLCYGLWSAALGAAVLAAWASYAAGLCCLELGPGEGLEAVSRLFEEAGVEGLSRVLNSLGAGGLCAAGLALHSLSVLAAGRLWGSA